MIDREILASSIREWGEREVLPHRHEIDARFDVAERAMKKLFLDLGLQKIVVPERLGGAGIDSELPSLVATIFEEVGKFDAGIGFALASTISASIASMQSEAFGYVSERLAKDFCRIAIVPPQFGENDYKGFELVKAEKHGEKIKLRGIARPLGLGLDAELFAVFCKYQGLSVAYVDEVERLDEIKSTGLVACRNCDVKIDAEISKEQIAVGRGSILRSWLNLCLSSLCLGSAIDSQNLVKKWAENRMVRGRLLKNNTVDATVLAEIAVRLEEIRAMIQSLIQDFPNYINSVVTVLSCSRKALEVADRAMELMASQGYAWEGLLEKQWRDSRTILSLVNEVHSLLEIAEWFYGSEVIA